MVPGRHEHAAGHNVSYCSWHSQPSSQTTSLTKTPALMPHSSQDVEHLGVK